MLLWSPQVPLSSAVALAVRQREEAEAREREEMKRLVLAASRWVHVYYWRGLRCVQGKVCARRTWWLG